MVAPLFLIALLAFLCFVLWKMFRRPPKEPVVQVFTQRNVSENPLERAVTEACSADGRYYRILLNAVIPKARGFERFELLLLHETGVYAFERRALLKKQRNVTEVLQKFLDPDASEFLAFDFLVSKKASTISPKEILELGGELEQMLRMGQRVYTPETLETWAEKIK